MTPAPSYLISCPFCGGDKKMRSIASGNTYGGTVWSDTRRHYPMLPEVSPLQRCPHCGKYYFIDQAKKRWPEEDDYRGELGELSYSELREAKCQMEGQTLTKMQRWILNHLLFMAYNDTYRRRRIRPIPSEKEQAAHLEVINELLEGIDDSKDYRLFHAELLREIGRFDEATSVLLTHDEEDDRWVVEAMLRHIAQHDTRPFLLIENGNVVADRP